jgi:hypothetical protein
MRSADAAFAAAAERLFAVVANQASLGLNDFVLF